MRDAAAPVEGFAVHFDRHPVELDRTLYGRERQRQQPALPGHAHHQHVAGDRIAEQRHRQALALDQRGRCAGDPAHALYELLGAGVPVGVARKFGCGRDFAAEHGVAAPGREHGHGLVARGDDQVAADQRVGLAGAYARRRELLGARREVQVRIDRAVFLRQAHHVEREAGRAIDVGRHGQHLAYGHDAGAADAAHEHVHGCSERRALGLGHIEALRRGSAFFGLAQAPAMHRDEARTKALDATEVFVASRLVDAPLAPEFGVERLDGQARGDLAAVAAAFAYGAMDEAALGRIFPLALLAQAPALGGAGLLVDDGRDARKLAHLGLHALHVAARQQRHAGGELHARVLLQVVGDHGDALHAVGAQGLDHLRHGLAAADGLPAGHGDEAVGEQLVGDGYARGHGVADGERARVRVSAIAEVREHVALLREGLLAHPLRALAAHLRDGFAIGRVEDQLHAMAAYAAERAAAGRQLGRAVVRAARAKARCAAHGGRALQRDRVGRRLPSGEAWVAFGKHLAEHARDHQRVDFARVGKEPGRAGVEQMARTHLAEHARRIGCAVEDGAHLVFDERALFFDHEHGAQPARELTHDLWIDGPDHAELEHAHAHRLCAFGVQAEVGERLAHLVVGFARANDAKPRLARFVRDAVEAIGARIGEGRVEAPVVERFFGGQDGGQARGLDPALGIKRRVSVWQGDGRMRGREPQHARALDHVGHELEAGPGAAVAAHGDAVQAVVEDLLHAAGVEHGHAQRFERDVGVAGHGGGLGAVVVADQRERAAQAARAGPVGVAQGIHRAVQPWPLAVPEAEHAVVFRAGEHVHVLRAPHRGGAEFLVHAGAKDDVVLLQQLARLAQRAVDRRERRTLVARDEARGVVAGGHVASALVEREAHQRLRAGHVGPALGEGVFVVERSVETEWQRVGHGKLLVLR